MTVTWIAFLFLHFIVKNTSGSLFLGIIQFIAVILELGFCVPFSGYFLTSLLTNFEFGVVIYEKSHSTTLVGGRFSKETLLATLYKYIPGEFLPEEYKFNLQE